jgi:aldehyde dehydrogenase (NAD+)
MISLDQSLNAMRRYYDSGATRSYAFRKEQLKKLKTALLENQDAFHEALYKDLKKSPEESWVTETGFLLSEINTTLSNLKDWMSADHVSTNLVNLPSKSYVLKEPLGVVLIIGPWNYPLQLLFTPMVGAIAAGNCVVLKASEFAPATAAVMHRIIAKIFPKEYILSVDGEGATVVPALMEHFRFDHIFYTGSTQVGRIIYQAAAKQLIPVTLELGGKSPCIVEEDANLAVAARRIVMTKFSNAGQMCVAPDYLLVHSSVKEKFIQLLTTAIRKFFTEDAASSENFGKIINEKQFDRLVQYLSQGKIIYGGQHKKEQLYFGPTLMENIQAGATILHEEIFGPILPIFGFDNEIEARHMVAENPNPLALYVFTSSRKKEKRWMSSIPFGGGCINNASWHLTNHHLPFGGRGNSGIGQYHGKNSFETFTHKKAIMKTPTWFDPSIKYPPFKGKLGLFKRIIR